MNAHQGQASWHRWIVVFGAFVTMMIISIYQYSWFLFAFAIQSQLKWDLATISLTFTIFTYTATFVQPFSGFIADSHGPRKVAVAASFLTAIGFMLASDASSPLSLYLSYGLGGLGVGVLYGISTACAIKWFPDKRGFATGLVVFGFGAGTALFNWFIQGMLESKGFGSTFMYIGTFMLTTLIPLSFLYKYPPVNASPSFNTFMKRNNESDHFRPIEMLKSHQWFIMYFSFIVTVSIVLMFGAQMRMLANEYNIPSHYFSIVLVLFPLGNGLSRIVAGAVSDRIGREKTMVIFYSLLGLSILSFMWLGHVPHFFVIIVFITATLGGAPFALYPATIGDYYGETYATTNYGITYTAKAWAGLISGWLSGYLVMTFGSYRIPLAVVGVCSLIAAFLSSPILLKSPRKSN